MIVLVILVVSVILLPVANLFLEGIFRNVLALVAAVVFMVSTSLIVLNQNNHFVMEKVTTTSEIPLVSSSSESPVDLLLYKALGNGEDKIYLYQTDAKKTELKQTGQDKTTNLVEMGNQEAILEKQTTHWQYKSHFYELLFEVEKEQSFFISEKNTFRLPNSWLVINTDQAEKMGKELKNNQDKIQADAKAYIGENLKKAMMENPEMTKEEQQSIAEELTTAFQKQMIEELIK